MKRLYIGLVIVSILTVTLCLYTKSHFELEIARNAKASEKQVEYTYTPQALLNILNRERAKVGAKPLVLDERLNKSAQLKVDDMVSKQYFSHYDPESKTLLGLERVKQIDNDCSYAFENLSLGNQTENPVLGWQTSPEHRKAQLDSSIETIGFASGRIPIAQNDSGKYSFNQYAYVAHMCDLGPR